MPAGAGRLVCGCRCWEPFYLPGQAAIAVSATQKLCEELLLASTVSRVGAPTQKDSDPDRPIPYR